MSEMCSCFCFFVFLSEMHPTVTSDSDVYGTQQDGQRASSIISWQQIEKQAIITLLLEISKSNFTNKKNFYSITVFRQNAKQKCSRGLITYKGKVGANKRPRELDLSDRFVRIADFFKKCTKRSNTGGK